MFAVIRPFMALVVSAATLAASTSSEAETLTVYAAGSLRGALSAIQSAYTAQTGVEFFNVYGPAGLLADRILSGDRVDLFASANIAHPQRLETAGISGPAIVFARNGMCAHTLSRKDIAEDNLLEKLLAPGISVGTSTPGSDPGGDYAWQVFMNAGHVVPGAEKILESKAKQLVGGKFSVTASQTVSSFLHRGVVDVFLGYCSRRTRTEDPSTRTLSLPPELAVTAQYAITELNGSPQAAEQFAAYLVSSEAQQILGEFGFLRVDP